MSYGLLFSASIALATVDDSYVSRNGLKLWLRADSMSQSDGSPVSVWPDQSGNGNDALQATPANQPTFGASVINELPAIHFTAASTTYLAIPDNGALAFSQVSIVAVVRRISGSGDARIVEKYTVNTSQGYAMRMTNLTTGKMVVDAKTASGAVPSGAFSVLEGTYDQINNSFYVNGDFKASTAYTSAIHNSSNGCVIGGRGDGLGLTGDIAEVLVYDHALSDDDRKDIEAYIYFKYKVGPPVAPTVVAISGDQQTGLVNQFNAAPFNVAVWNSAGTAPLVGWPVAFTVTSGEGQLSATNDANATLGTSLSLTTDAYGTVNAYYKQGGTPFVTSTIQAASGGASVQLTTYSTDDSDGNGLSDAWEVAFFGAIGVNPNANPDGDDLTNIQEYQQGRNPLVADAMSSLYVDGVRGLDVTYNGRSAWPKVPTVVDGPKATLHAAISAALTGDTILISSTGTPYQETTLSPVGKTLVLRPVGSVSIQP